jgi:1-deoxy-D-xylulose-5-phosphate reductoisomerase
MLDTRFTHEPQVTNCEFEIVMAKRIAILGSTGSVGRKALQVIDALGSEYTVVALSAHSNIRLLAEQARRHRPKFIAVTNADYAHQLRELVGGLGIEILAGPESLADLAQLEEVDIVLTAVVGAAGLPAALAAVRKGKRLAIANKEPLVIAGELLTREAKENGSIILPVDSEHSAIFQAMRAGNRREVRKIILTASGGPFKDATTIDIQNVTLEQTLLHPVWDMGPKITVDSATMMNKALEIIEARWLFDIPVEQIEVLVHPESVVHSLVEFVDGSVIAQLAVPDMCLPIQYALTYPERVAGIGKSLRLDQIGKLTFERPNLETFRALSLGYKVAKAGGTAAAVFNAANETAVREFLAGRIRFANIIELVEHCLSEHNVKMGVGAVRKESRSPLEISHVRNAISNGANGVGIEELLEADAWARREVLELIHQPR